MAQAAKTLFNSNKLFSRASVASFSTSHSSRSFKFDDLKYELNPTKPDLPADPKELIFGHKFSDHMFSVEWTEQDGWKQPKISRVENLSIHPAAKVLHYSVEIFEGMKAYYGVDKQVRLFRPDKNADRFLKSSLRSALPDFDKEELTKCLTKLISIDKEWIPKSTSASLYIRPTLIGTEPTLGVSKSSSALMYILTSPIGPYFPTGFKPIRLLADPQYVRAFHGGVGNVKVGSNYGPTIYVGIEANKLGCQQVLWLLGEEEYITEAGTMNIFMVIQNDQGETELITPPLDGTILEGITRQSILDMTKQWDGIKVTERKVSMKEAMDLHSKNRLIEMFGAGTACIVCPVDEILYNGQTHKLPTMTSGGKIMSRISKTLLDIQYGVEQHEWAPIVP